MAIKSISFVLSMLLFASLSSCVNQKKALELKVLDENTAVIYPLKNCLGKEILYIGMHHVGTQIFFDDVKQKVDSLKQCGYVVFYEGIDKDTAISGILKIAVYRKYVIIMGGSTNGYKFQAYADSSHGKYVVQPVNLGYSGNDVRTDLTITDVVKNYEKWYGVLKEPLNDRKEQRRRIEALCDIRNEKVLSDVKSSVYSKILILYGLGHKKEISKGLRKSCS